MGESYRKSQKRDLGIFVTDDLKPSVQCAKATARALQVLAVIKRNFVLTDEEDFQLLFNGLSTTTRGILCVCLVSLFSEGY